MDEPLRIAVCEDDSADAGRLSALIDGVGAETKTDIFASGEALLAAFHAGKYDLIFMDIYMGGMKGVDAASAIREKDELVVLAFTTNSLDHTLESYRLGALKYLEKPVTMGRVKETLELAFLKRKPGASVNILTGGKYLDIPLDNIHYFEQQNHAIEVHTSSGVLKTSQTVRMDDIEKRLPSPPFVRCHHSFIVNLRYVRRIDAEYKLFVMKNGENVHIRHNLLKKMKAAHEDYIFEQVRGNDE